MLRLNSRDSGKYSTRVSAPVKPVVALFQREDIGGTANLQRKRRPLGAYEAAAWVMVKSRPPSGSLRRAELTQLVECQLPKLDVAGSTPVLRSIFPRQDPRFPRGL